MFLVSGNRWAGRGLALAGALVCWGGLVAAQPSVIAAVTERELNIDSSLLQGGVRPVTIPITVRWRGDDKESSEITDIGALRVLEDGDEQEIVSVRAIGTADPLYLAVLIQDDAVSAGNEIKPLQEFIRRLPNGSRVLTGYLRSGSLQIRQKFTNDLDKAAKSLRIPAGQASVAPYNPYVEVLEALKRFESQPKGRRALLLVSDGVDISHGVDDSSPGQSNDLQRAITAAQGQATAIYTIYTPTSAVAGRNGSLLENNGQGSLNRLSDETGGRSFFQGTGAPVSFDPFLKKLGTIFKRQLALTYLSTHLKKGYHRVKVMPGNRDITIEHPSGYTR